MSLGSMLERRDILEQVQSKVSEPLDWLNKEKDELDYEIDRILKA